MTHKGFLYFSGSGREKSNDNQILPHRHTDPSHENSMRYDMRNTADFKKLPVYPICKDNGSGPKFQIFPVLIFAAARHVSHKPFIPPYPADLIGSESLSRGDRHGCRPRRIPPAGGHKEIKLRIFRQRAYAATPLQIQPLSSRVRRGVCNLSPHGITPHTAMPRTIRRWSS